MLLYTRTRKGLCLLQRLTRARTVRCTSRSLIGHDVFFDGPCPVFRLSSFGQGLCVAEASRASLVPSLQLAFDEQQSFASRVSQSSIISFGSRATSYVTAGPHLHLKQLGWRRYTWSIHVTGGQS